MVEINIYNPSWVEWHSAEFTVLTTSTPRRSKYVQKSG